MMCRTLLLSIAPCFLLALPGHAERAVALQGEAAPGSGGGTLSTQFAPSINDAGDVTWRAQISGGTASQGLFLDAGSGVEAIAVIGDAAPDTGGATFSGFGEPVVNAGGAVSFSAQLSGGTATWGVFLYSEGVISALATTQTPAPDTGGGNYSAFGSRIAINASGDVAFFANVGSGSTTGGIFVYEEGVARAVFLYGDAVPAGIAGTYFNVSPPALNDSGEVAVAASILLDAGGFDSGVVVSRTGGDVYAAREGDAAPDSGGGTYSFFLFTAPPGIDAAGNVYFRSDVAGGTTGEGYFVDSAGTDAAVVLQGETPPETGGSFFVFSDSGASVNASGAVGFSANLVGASSGQGLFLSPASSANEALALLGDEAPETGGATFAQLGDSPSIDAFGRAAFRGLYTGAATGWGIFVVPEPAGAASALAAVGVLAGLRRRRAGLFVQ